MKHLVILAPNWLGDAVMALPAIADVCRGASGASVVVAARPAVAPLFALVPDIAETIVLGRAPSIAGVSAWRGIGGELADRGFDAALLLPNSIHAALLASRAGISERWGYRSPFRTRLLTRAVARPRALHQIDYYRRLVAELGFPNGSGEPRIAVPEDAKAAGARLLAAAGWDLRRPIVALAPGAAYGGAKRWAPESFAALAAALDADGISCAIVGSAADAATAAEVRREFAGRRQHAALVDLVGQTDLPALAGVLTHCRALVTNDSGAMHLAAAAGVAVTAIFGPTNERATGPRGDAHLVCSHAVWCRPCMLRECPIDHRCMRGVGVGVVLDAARRTL